MLIFAVISVILVILAIALIVLLRNTRLFRDFTGEFIMLAFVTAILGVLTLFGNIPLYRPAVAVSLGALAAADICLGIYFYSRRSTSLGNALAFETMRSPVIIFGIHNKIITVNPAAMAFFDLKKEDIGKITTSVFFREKLYMDSDDSIDEKEICLPDSCYQEHYYDVTDKPLLDNDQSYFGRILIFRETTAVRLATKDATFFATHDSLTGMLNRYGYQTNFPKFVSEASLPISVVSVNVNNLKIINDAYGTNTGDMLLRVLADSVTRICRGKKGLFARVGGDEMLMLLPDTDIAEARMIDNNLREMIEAHTSSIPSFSVAVGYATQATPNELLDLVINEASVNMYKNKLVNTESSYGKILDCFKTTLSQSNYETDRHAARTVSWAIKLGRHARLHQKDLDDLALLAQLHDIGKISTPIELIQKPGKLDKDEWEIMKLHTVKGYKIASSHPALSAIAREIQCHHERWDGTGYPNGIAGEDIPNLSRMISIVDSFDVMINTRPYQKAISVEAAVDELRRCAGGQFDPNLVPVFIDILKSEQLIPEDY